MIKKYELEDMIKGAVFNLDGHMSDKPDQDGKYDLYFVEVQEQEDGMLVDFETWIGCDPNNCEHDKYKIKIEYVK